MQQQQQQEGAKVVLDKPTNRCMYMTGLIWRNLSHAVKSIKQGSRSKKHCNSYGPLLQTTFMLGVMHLDGEVDTTPMHLTQTSRKTADMNIHRYKNDPTFWRSCVIHPNGN
jgi:hypothetical protein